MKNILSILSLFIVFQLSALEVVFQSSSAIYCAETTVRTLIFNYDSEGSTMNASDFNVKYALANTTTSILIIDDTTAKLLVQTHDDKNTQGIFTIEMYDAATDQTVEGSIFFESKIRYDLEVLVETDAYSNTYGFTVSSILGDEEGDAQYWYGIDGDTSNPNAIQKHFEFDTKVGADITFYVRNGGCVTSETITMNAFELDTMRIDIEGFTRDTIQMCFSQKSDIEAIAIEVDVTSQFHDRLNVYLSNSISATEFETHEIIKNSEGKYTINLHPDLSLENSKYEAEFKVFAVDSAVDEPVYIGGNYFEYRSVATAYLHVIWSQQPSIISAAQVDLSSYNIAFELEYDLLGPLFMYVDDEYMSDQFTGVWGQTISPGNYEYKIGEGKCTDSVHVDVERLASIEVLTNNFAIYPSPTNSWIHIEYRQLHDIESIIIYDLLGQELINAGNTSKLDVSHLEHGQYYIQLATKHNTFVQSFIKY